MEELKKTGIPHHDNLWEKNRKCQQELYFHQTGNLIRKFEKNKGTEKNRENALVVEKTQFESQHIDNIAQLFLSQSFRKK